MDEAEIGFFQKDEADVSVPVNVRFVIERISLAHQVGPVKHRVLRTEDPQPFQKVSATYLASGQQSLFVRQAGQGHSLALEGVGTHDPDGGIGFR
jgi:hypothetical protein